MTAAGCPDRRVPAIILVGVILGACGDALRPRSTTDSGPARDRQVDAEPVAAPAAPEQLVSIVPRPAAAPPYAASDAAEQFARVRLLHEELQLIVRRYRRRKIGVHVMDEAGQVLFAHNANLSFNPASNVKLITAGTALSLLGPRHRFITALLGRAVDGRVAGALTLRGGGDPSLTTDGLIALARQLREAGVREVDGPLILDTSAFDIAGDPPGYRSFTGPNAFRASVSALSLNGNAVRIAVIPGVPGGAATVLVSPPSEHVVLRGRVRTSRRQTRLRVVTYRHGDRTGVRVAGRISARGGTLKFWRRVYEPARYAGQTLAAILRTEGIALPERLRIIGGRAPEDAPLIAEHRSSRLPSVLRATVKHSSNVRAELLLLAAGAALEGLPATYRKARHAMATFLDDVGVPRGSYRIENGSGLSRRSRLRPAVLVQVLRGIYRDFAIGPEILSALPIAGVDGTLHWRLKHADVQGAVRAKTGTLSGVTCLSGYAGHGGRMLFFSVMALRAGRLGALRWIQERIARALVRYLRQLPDATDRGPEPQG